MEKVVIPFLLIFTVVFGMYQCHHLDVSDRELDVKIQQMRADAHTTCDMNKIVSDILLEDACRKAVEHACDYADCATMPIEKMQDKVCGEK